MGFELASVSPLGLLPNALQLRHAGTRNPAVLIVGIENDRVT